ncbi:VF530 family protein [Pelobium sp.]|nr:VF530 family protein [Pelobium sp.]MDA9555218.1 VF530 family protein [Pelobium sp.]
MPQEKENQANNPLHGVTLENILTDLVAYVGWEAMAAKVPIKCFSKDPSIKSSLNFLRKTPWARRKVEILYEYRFNHIQRSKAQEK